MKITQLSLYECFRIIFIHRQLEATTMAGPATGFPPELPTFLSGRGQTVYQSADRLPESEHETLANG